MSADHGLPVCAMCMQGELCCHSLFCLLIGILVGLCWAWMRTVSSHLGGDRIVLQEEGTEHAEDANKRTVSFLPGVCMPLE